MTYERYFHPDAKKELDKLDGTAYASAAARKAD